MKIIHIVEASVWMNEANREQYFEDSLKNNGFIHCCLSSQVDFVLHSWFSNSENLIIIEINSELLQSPLNFENLEGGKEKFPHIYGPINKDAMITWYPLRKEKDKMHGN
jgi:uncharacterized protein (DUF952 family)